MKEKLVPIAAAGVLGLGGVAFLAHRWGLSVDLSGLRQTSTIISCDDGSTATETKTLVGFPFQLWRRSEVRMAGCDIDEVLFPPQRIDVDFVSQVDNMNRVLAVGENFPRLAIKMEKNPIDGGMDEELSSSAEEVSRVLANLNMTAVSLNATLGDNELAVAFSFKEGIYQDRDLVEVRRGKMAFLIAESIGYIIASTEEYFATGDGQMRLVFPITVNQLMGIDFLLFFNQGVLGGNQNRARVIPLRFRVIPKYISGVTTA